MFQTILVPTDFGELSCAAEEKALALAQLCGARCVLLHVVEAIDDASEEIEQFYRGLEERAEARLTKSAGRFEALGVSCETRTRVAKRWAGILETAEESGADLIVLGSRPLVQGGKPTLGTTSHHVFFAASCPLLIVRPAPA